MHNSFLKIVSFAIIFSMALASGVNAEEDTRLNLEANTQSDSTDTTSGDPDRPIITGDVADDSDNNDDTDRFEIDTESRGVEHDDIGITDGDDDSASDSVPSGSQTAPSQVRVILLAPASDSSSDSLDSDTRAQLSSLGIDEEDFGFISNGDVYVRAGFVKFGDIKGESGETEDKKGKIENTWAVGRAEKAKKPKEIVVVGSKTTDSSTPKLFEALCGGTHAICEAKDAVTPDGLLDYAQRVVNSLDSVSEIRLGDSKVEMDSEQDFHLFGLLPMRLRQTISVSMDQEEFGRVKVKFPWYHVFGRKTVRPHDLKTDLETGISSTQISKWKGVDIDGKNGENADVPIEEVTFNFEEVKAQLLSAMGNSLAQYNESDLQFLNR